MRWSTSHDGSPNMTAYHGPYLYGQVARYDDVGGQGPGWVGYVHGQRVTGRCQSALDAQRIVESTAATHGKGVDGSNPRCRSWPAASN